MGEGDRPKVTTSAVNYARIALHSTRSSAHSAFHSPSNLTSVNQPLPQPSTASIVFEKGNTLIYALVLSKSVWFSIKVFNAGLEYWRVVLPWRCSSDTNTIGYLPEYRYRVSYRNVSIYTEYGRGYSSCRGGGLLYGLDLLTLML